MDRGKEVVGNDSHTVKPENDVAANLLETSARLPEQSTTLAPRRKSAGEIERKRKHTRNSIPDADEELSMGKTKDAAPTGDSLSALTSEEFALRPATPPSSSLHLIGSPASVDSVPSSVLSSTYTPSVANSDFVSSPTTPNTPHHSTNSKTADGKSEQLPDVEFDREGPDGHKILHLKPTEEQWRDFPTILKFAQALGAAEDGCFKVTLPPGSYEPSPDRGGRVVKGQAYRIKQIKRNSFWQVHTVPSQGMFDPTKSNGENVTGAEDSVHEAIGKLKKMFNKNNGKRLRQVLYRVDVPAWTPEQREDAGVPAKSPIHPLQGDKLEETKAIVPGIHTPYVYESAAPFGATFQVHAEDYRLVSLNHLYKGRKIWIVVPSTEIETAEVAWKRKSKCSQFMRHRAEFFFPAKLEQLGIPYRIVDQRPGETIVVLPDAYHEGFSTGYTLAEAKNYADPEWSTDKYQACNEDCKLLTAIPASHMALLKDGEERLDICAHYNTVLEAADEDAEGEEIENDDYHMDQTQDLAKPAVPLPTVSLQAGSIQEEAMKRRAIDGQDEPDSKRAKMC